MCLEWHAGGGMLSGTVDIDLTINGAETRITAEPETPLLYILRNDLCLNGPKYGCGLGECGACAVLIDGHVARSCTVPVGALPGKSVITLEGLGTSTSPHPVQTAFIQNQAAQCGYCLNGMIIAIVALLKRIPSPSEDDIRSALRHHLCRCGTHMEILAAARSAAAICRDETQSVQGDLQ